MAKKVAVLSIELDVDAYSARAIEIEKEQKILIAQNKELAKSGKETSLSYQQNKERLAALKTELRDTNKTIDNVTKATKSQIGSNNQLKAQLSVLTMEYNRLSKEERDNTAAGKSLQANINNITSTLKANEKAVGDNRRNVGNYADSLKGLQSVFATLGIAVGLHEIIDFGKDSVAEFLKAEAGAKKLEFAIRNIGGEGGSALGKLLSQASELQEKSIFGAGEIKEAQTALVQYGLTSKQVEKLIPQILDLATAQGTTLATATDKAIGAIGGQTKGLKEAGIAFKDTGSKTENFAILTEKLNKFQGASADALTTTEGKAKRLANAFSDLKESIGEAIVSEGNNFLDLLDAFSGKFDETIAKKAFDIIRKPLEQSSKILLENASKSDKARIESIKITQKAIADLAKKGLETEDATQKQLIAMQLKNRQQLLADLQNLGKRKEEILEDSTKAEKDAIDYEKILRDLQTNNITFEYEKRRKLILDNFDDESKKYEGHTKILIELEKQKNIELVKLERERNAEYDKIRKDAESKAIEDFQKSAKAMEVVDTTFSVGVKKRYDERLAKARETLEAIKALEQLASDFAKQTVANFYEFKNNKIQSDLNALTLSTDTQIQNLQRQLDQGLIDQATFDAQKTQLERDAQKKSSALKRKQFENQKKASQIQTGINIAEGVANALTVKPAYLAAAQAIAALALGAQQLALIESAPIPAFANSGLSGKKIEASDGIKINRSNGDNLLATVKTDEVILNQHHQQMLGGAPTFKAIGVPGFASSGITDGGAFANSLSNGIEQRISQSNAVSNILKNLKVYTIVQEVTEKQGIVAETIDRANI